MTYRRPKPRRLLNRFVLYSMLAGTSMSAPSAHAALGDLVEPIAGATSRTFAGGAVSVLRYVDAGGTTINEYFVSANGVVFAYTWQGPTMPNLRALLGSYDASYRENASSELSGPRGSLHAVRVDEPEVVVEVGGQMRSYVGRAWLPTALPPGVTEGDLQ